MDHLLFLHVHVYVIGFFSKWRKKRLREALYVHDRKKKKRKQQKENTNKQHETTKS